MKTEIKNAIIIKTDLMIEDHGLLVADLTLDYGGSCQGFGGYRLDREKNHTSANDFGAIYIRRLLETVGVQRWEDLVGKPIRVKVEYGLAIAISNIIKDKWFDPKQLAEELKRYKLVD